MRSVVREVRDRAVELSKRVVRRSVPLVVLTGALALLQTGCASRSAPVTIGGMEVLEHTPTIALDVENSRGAVLVTVNPRLTAPRVFANAGTLRGEPVENYQGGKWASAQFTESDGRAVLTVRNLPQEGEAERWVQIDIEVPSCDGLRVKNADGVVDARGVNGAITIQNGGAGKPGGDVYVEGEKPNTSAIMITTASGDVDLVLPTDSTGNIELISGNGALAAIVAWTGQVTNSVIKPGWYSGILNWGTNQIRVKSSEGEVRLRIGPYRVGNPQRRYYKDWFFSMLDGGTARPTSG